MSQVLILASVGFLGCGLYGPQCCFASVPDLPAAVLVVLVVVDVLAPIVPGVRGLLVSPLPLLV